MGNCSTFLLLYATVTGAALSGYKSIVMRYIIFLLLTSVLVAGCSKDNTITSDELSGSWKMIRVYDKTAGTDYGQPSGLSGSVVIRFNNGEFTGHTLVNEITGGSYKLLGDKKIEFGVFSMTKVAEDDWGKAFLTVLHSCMLQSLYPCKPAEITYQPGLRRIKIATTLKYDILLEKL
jgi:heat shock protein HslJ